MATNPQTTIDCVGVHTHLLEQPHIVPLVDTWAGHTAAAAGVLHACAAKALGDPSLQQRAGMRVPIMHARNALHYAGVLLARTAEVLVFLRTAGWGKRN